MTIIDLAVYVIATLLYIVHKVKIMKTKITNVKYTDLSHAALAMVAANLVSISLNLAIASAIITALYVVYQMWGDRSSKDIAVYTATYTITIAVKHGISITML